MTAPRTPPADLSELTALVEGLRAEVTALSSRVAWLEASRDGAAQSPGSAVGTGAGQGAGDAVRSHPSDEEAMSDELLIVIAAAVAAFLGERAHIRQVRLINSPLWAQQGRASLQASHRLDR